MVLSSLQSLMTVGYCGSQKAREIVQIPVKALI
jgi:hypothetical protein